MRIGVIGVGHMGTLHAQRLTAMGHTIITSDPYKQADYRHPRHLLAQNLDGVVIASPSEYHVSHAKLAFEFNTPMLIEKPLAVNEDNLDELIAIQDSTGTSAMVGHIERFNPAVVELPTFVGDDATAIDFVRIGPRPPSPPQTGIAYDLLPHDIDLAILFLGPAILAQQLSKSGPDNASVGLVHSGGRRSTILASWGSDTKERMMTVDASDTIYKVDLLNKTISSGEIKLFHSYEEPLVNELNAFIGMLRGENESPVTIIEAAIPVRIISSVVHKGVRFEGNEV